MEQALISSGNEVRFKNFHLILNSQLQNKIKKKKKRIVILKYKFSVS
jgi:hypothetical protein